MNKQASQLESLFFAALEIETPEQRLAFLESACGDDTQLRLQLLQMLRSHDQPGNFMALDSSDAAVTLAHDSGPAADEWHPEDSAEDKEALTLAPGEPIGAKAENDVSFYEQPTATQPQTKSVTIGRYELLGELGRGGMGVILKGRDPQLGRELAIKMLLERHRDRPGVARRFIEEAQIAGQLQHPGIAPVHELGHTHGLPYFSMKLVRGDTLATLLSQRGAVSDDRSRFLSVFEQICQTVAYAHSRGVIHRDLKPANIMVGKFGEVQVMDWGLAKVLSSGGEEVVEPTSPLEQQADPSSTHEHSIVQTIRSQSKNDTDGVLDSRTRIGSVLGTPAYMPPEQAQGANDRLDERADVFGLGAILCEILSGQPPYVGDNWTQVFSLASRGELADAHARLEASAAEAELVTLAKNCLAVDPNQRPRDASAVAAAVNNYLTGVQQRLHEAEVERAAESARAEQAMHTVAEAQAKVRAERKARQWQATVGMTVTAVLLLGGALAWRWQDQRRTQQETAAREMSRLMSVADARYAQAQGAERDLVLWADAKSAVLQAKEQATVTESAQLPRIDGLLSEIELVQKKLKLADELQSIHADMSEIIDARELGRNETLKINARYEKAIEDFGGTSFKQSTEEFARLLRKRTDKFDVRIASALDNWALVHWLLTKDMEEADRLFQISRMIDPDPDRNFVRSTLIKAEQAAMVKLLSQIDPAKQSRETLDLLTSWQLDLIGINSEVTTKFLRDSQRYHPDNFQVNNYLAWCLASQGKAEEAIPYCMVAIALRPKSSIAWIYYAEVLKLNNRDEASLAAFHRGVELSPMNWPILLDAAEMLEKNGSTEKAKEQYRRAATAVLENPNDHQQTFAAIAARFQHHGMLAELEAELNANLEKDPTSLNLKGFAAEVLCAKKEWDSAIDQFTLLLDKNPTDTAILERRASAYEATDRKQLAAADWLKAGLLNARRTQHCMGRCRVLEQWKEAAELGLMEVRNKPQISVIWLHIAPSIVLSENPTLYKEFCRDLQRQFRDSLYPNDIERMVKCCLLQPDAVELSSLPGDRLQKILEESSDTILLGWTWFAKALLMLRSGDFPAALECVDKCLTIPKQVPDYINCGAWAVAAMAQYRLGDIEKAKEALDKSSQCSARLRALGVNNTDHDLVIAELLNREAARLIESAK